MKLFNYHNNFLFLFSLILSLTYELNLIKEYNLDSKIDSKESSLRKVEKLLDDIKNEQVNKFTNLKNMIEKCNVESELKKNEYLHLQSTNDNLFNKTEFCRHNFTSADQINTLLQNEIDNLKFALENSDAIRNFQSNSFVNLKLKFEESLNILEEMKIDSKMITYSKDNSNLSTITSKLILSAIQTGVLSKVSPLICDLSKNLKHSTDAKPNYESFLQIKTKQTSLITNEMINSINRVQSEIKKVLQNYSDRENESAESYLALKTETTSRLAKIKIQIEELSPINMLNKKCAEEGEAKLKEISVDKERAYKVFISAQAVCVSFTKEYETANLSFDERIKELNDLRSRITIK